MVANTGRKNVSYTIYGTFSRNSNTLANTILFVLRNFLVEREKPVRDIMEHNDKDTLLRICEI